MGDTNLNLKLLSPSKSRIDEKILPLQKLDISWCEVDGISNRTDTFVSRIEVIKSRACDYMNDMVFELATTCTSLQHVNIARCNCVRMIL